MFLKATAPLLLAVFLSAPAHAQSGPGATGPNLLIHGNYCGRGNNAPLAPIDDLDAACARHDACTPDGGLPSKSCNQRLQVEAERVADDGRQPENLRMMASLVASGAAMMPADAPGPYVVVAHAPTAAVVHRAGTRRRLQPAASQRDGE